MWRKLFSCFCPCVMLPCVYVLAGRFSCIVWFMFTPYELAARGLVSVILLAFLNFVYFWVQILFPFTLFNSFVFKVMLCLCRFYIIYFRDFNVRILWTVYERTVHKTLCDFTGNYQTVGTIWELLMPVHKVCDRLVPRSKPLSFADPGGKSVTVRSVNCRPLETESNV